MPVQRGTVGGLFLQVPGGHGIENGVYFAVMRSASGSVTQRFVLLR